MRINYVPSTAEARAERMAQMIATHGVERIVFALMEQMAARPSELNAILAVENERAEGMPNSL